jgi:hypothetical protein
MDDNGSVSEKASWDVNGEDAAEAQPVEGKISPAIMRWRWDGRDMPNWGFIKAEIVSAESGRN